MFSLAYALACTVVYWYYSNEGVTVLATKGSTEASLRRNALRTTSSEELELVCIYMNCYRL